MDLSPQNIYRLSSSIVNLGNNALGEGIKQTVMTKEELKRIDQKKIEACYIRDPTTFRGINTITETFSSADYTVKCSNPKDQEIVDSFLNCSQFYDKIMPRTIQDQCIYGNAWMEKLYGTKSGRITSIDMIDPKSMDFLRDVEDNIKYTEEGKPESYVQYIAMKDMDKAGENVVNQKGRSAMKIDPKFILHMPLFTIGNNPDGIGLIEPIYDSIITKKNIEKGWGQSSYEVGFPKLILKIGSPEYPPTPGDIAHMKQEIKEMDDKSRFVVPWHYQFEYLESKQLTLLENQLDYFIDQQVSGMGVPKALLTGVGTDVNRSTLVNQVEIFMKFILRLQHKLKMGFENGLFLELKQQYNLKDTPQIIFEDIQIGSTDAKVSRLTKLVEKGLLTVDDDLMGYIKDLENLPRKTE